MSRGVQNAIALKMGLNVTVVVPAILSHVQIVTSKTKHRMPITRCAVRRKLFARVIRDLKENSSRFTKPTMLFRTKSRILVTKILTLLIPVLLTVISIMVILVNTQY